MDSLWFPANRASSSLALKEDIDESFRAGHDLFAEKVAELAWYPPFPL
jgi:hypothetical protein